jgi:hypothetical protein
MTFIVSSCSDKIELLRSRFGYGIEFVARREYFRFSIHIRSRSPHDYLLPIEFPDGDPYCQLELYWAELEVSAEDLDRCNRINVSLGKTFRKHG